MMGALLSSATHRVRLYRVANTITPSGAPGETWHPLSGLLWASRRPLIGKERFGGVQLVALEQVEFHVRWAKALSAVSPRDRLVEQVAADLVRKYDIRAVYEIGRRELLRIIGTRQVPQ